LRSVSSKYGANLNNSEILRKKRKRPTAHRSLGKSSLPRDAQISASSLRLIEQPPLTGRCLELLVGTLFQGIAHYCYSVGVTRFLCLFKSEKSNPSAVFVIFLEPSDPNALVVYELFMRLLWRVSRHTCKLALVQLTTGGFALFSAAQRAEPPTFIARWQPLVATCCFKYRYRCSIIRCLRIISPFFRFV
jgi:hypothetical protein